MMLFKHIANWCQAIFNDPMEREVYRNRYFEEYEKAICYSYACDNNYSNIYNISQPHIEKIRGIYFELSNLCNYAFIHKKCPASYQRTTRILSAQLVFSVIDELAEFEYNGFVSFHRYNEPLIDPRLYEFITYTRKKLPNAHIVILTNGFYLNDVIAGELRWKGVNCLMVSAYSIPEFNRLCRMNIDYPYQVIKSLLDTRLDMYDRTPIDFPKPCYALVNDVTINSEGKVVLCCLDWKNMHEFGDLRKHKLKDIMQEKKFQKAHNDLISGRRNLHLCKRCDWSR